jgi:hypothetical protein
MTYYQKKNRNWLIISNFDLRLQWAKPKEVYQLFADGASFY